VPQAEVQEKLKSRAELAETLGRCIDHLAANGVDLAQTKPVFGAALEVMKDQERFVSTSNYDLGFWANRMLTRTYRPPFVVPEKV
jgi:hypothetical protein